MEERASTHRKNKRSRERKAKSALAPPFICFFPSPWACPMQIGLSQECCLFFLRSSLRSSDLPLTFLCSIFAGFSLPRLLATAILDSCFLFYLPNKRMSQSSRFAAITDGELVSPERTQEVKNTCHLATIRLQSLPTVTR